MHAMHYVGFLAAVMTTISFLPQALRTIKTKETKDLSLWMYIFLNTGLALWLIYGIWLHSWPIILANAISLVFCLIILGMKMIYK
ncbi:MAG: SemiSWEET transporter [Candidatus Omnitrophica bacterium]|nr:SemiSWEET transporter [Candidatus Omnitrophota bacterium]